MLLLTKPKIWGFFFFFCIWTCIIHTIVALKQTIIKQNLKENVKIYFINHDNAYKADQKSVTDVLCTYKQINTTK